MDKQKAAGMLENSAVKQVVDIQHAVCPNGCNLMCEHVKIHGMKSIRVKIKSKDQEGTIYLDPEFGKYNHISEVEMKEGEIVELFCPHCGVTLTDETETCQTCSAPLFRIEIPDEGAITACLRKGCFNHTLSLENLDAMHLELDDDMIRVIM